MRCVHRGQIRRREAHPDWQHHASKASQRQEWGARQILGVIVRIAHALELDYVGPGKEA